MQFSNPDFSATTRTLTSFGSGALGIRQDVNVSIAANATVNFQVNALTSTIITIAAKADASGTVVLSFTDGTNTWTVLTIAAGTIGGQATIMAGNLTFPSLKNNSATVAGAYFTAGYNLKQ